MLETLAGLSIFAIAMTSLYGAYATGLKASHTSERHAQAQLLAQSLLARTTTPSNAPPRSDAGMWHRFAWQVTVKPAASHIAGSAAASGLRLYHVTVDVRWNRDRHIRLETLELRRRPS